VATVLTATHRITISYIVAGSLHKYRAYCKRQDPLIGDPAVLDRDGGLITWTDAAEGLWGLVNQLYNTAVAAASALFEERSGAVWLPIASATLAAVGTDATPYAPAQQITWVIRDTAFKKIRAVWLETSQPYIGHSNTVTGLSAGVNQVGAAYQEEGAFTNNAFRWQKSRGDNYILATGAVAGVTFDLNDKLKRGRGLE